MNDQTPPLPLTAQVKRFIRAAVDAHRPVFNSEIRPSDFELADAKKALQKAYEAVDKLAGKK